MKKASGFLLYYDNVKGLAKGLAKEKLILVLKDINNKGDFPKGVVEEKKCESLMQCAIRETKEETGLIINKDYKIIDNSYFYNKTGLHIFLGKVLCINGNLPEIKFTKNPVTDIIEHTEYYWLTYEEAYLLLPSYLKKFLKTYKEKLNEQWRNKNHYIFKQFQ